MQTYTEDDIVALALEWAENFLRNAEAAPQVERERTVDSSHCGVSTMVDIRHGAGASEKLALADIPDSILFETSTPVQFSEPFITLRPHASFTKCAEPINAARLILNRTVDKPGAVFVMRMGSTLVYFRLTGAMGSAPVCAESVNTTLESIFG